MTDAPRVVEVVIPDAPAVVEVVIPDAPAVVEVRTFGPQGPEGPEGPQGRGITVSATPPANPQVNDLWVDIS